MGKFITLLMAASLLAIPASDVRAQVANTAANEARIRLACGTGRVVSAETLANGTIRVTCQQSSRLPSALGGAALSPAAAAGISVIFLCVVACGGTDSEGTTTSTRSFGGES